MSPEQYVTELDRLLEANEPERMIQLAAEHGREVLPRLSPRQLAAVNSALGWAHWIVPEEQVDVIMAPARARQTVA